jgi:hypothetical protein
MMRTRSRASDAREPQNYNVNISFKKEDLGSFFVASVVHSTLVFLFGLTLEIFSFNVVPVGFAAAHPPPPAPSRRPRILMSLL